MKSEVIKRNSKGLLSGNKGEWSEIYVLFKLLADGKIYAADEELNQLKDIFFPIIKIFRKENSEDLIEYQTKYLTKTDVKIFLNGKNVCSIPAHVFREQADYLLKELNKGETEIEKTENFMKKINCYKLKAPSTHKADITMQVVDVNTQYQPTIAFSIKSDLGSPPTLLNAGKTTNFTYKIENLDPKEIDYINSLTHDKKKDIKGRTEEIEKKGGKITFKRVNNKAFKGNLTLVDSCMDRIIAETVLYYYRDGIKACKDMVEILEEKNPLKYENINAYSYKFKKFLTAVALGLRPGTAWNGEDEVNGGYIIVTKNGNVLAYHIYNRNFFEEYLLRNTKYETASTTKHDFGTIYSENGELYINLNLQIRFI